MSLFIKNANFIHWQDMSATLTDIRVEEGPAGGIQLLGPSGMPPAESGRVVDAAGKFVTKSFGCGHHHIYSTLARGMPAPSKNPENFTDILTYIWWNLDKNLDLDMIRASALASALYCAKNGVTFVIDHHASPFAVEGCLSVIRDAFDTVGISHLLCYEISGRDGDAVGRAGLEETRDYLSGGNPGHVGLHASFTVGDSLLGQAVALAENLGTGIHIHAAEDRADQDLCLERHGKRVIQRLAHAGALDLPGTILAHCIHLDDGERRLLREAGTWIVQNTESNQNNNVGLGNYADLGPNIMLGTDGMHSDMLRSAKAAFLAGQSTDGAGFDGTYQRFRNVHRYISSQGFTGDGDNNLVVLDYDPPTRLTPENFPGHFIFGMDSRHVESVISNGRLIVENRKLVTADEADILGFAREMGDRLWKKL